MLSARIENRNPAHCRIGVFQNGGKAGVLTVDADEAELLCNWLNGVERLVAAAEDVLTTLVDCGGYGPDLPGDETTDCPRDEEGSAWYPDIWELREALRAMQEVGAHGDYVESADDAMRRSDDVVVEDDAHAD